MLVKFLIIMSTISCANHKLSYRSVEKQKKSKMRPAEEQIEPLNEPSVVSASNDNCKPILLENLQRPGSYPVKIESVGSFTLFYPSDIEQRRCRHIGIAWGNGTGRFGGLNYKSLHEFWASHGIVVAVSHSGATASGGPIKEAIDLLERVNADSSSIFHNKIASRFIVSGQSQGGLGASAASSDERVESAIPMGGASVLTSKKALFITNDGDYLRTLVSSAYQASKSGSLMVTSSGGSHPTVPFTAAAKSLSVVWSQCSIFKDPLSCEAIGNGCKFCDSLALSAKKVKP